MRSPASLAAAALDTPIGQLRLAAADDGLTDVRFPCEDGELATGPGSVKARSHLGAALRALEGYFAGSRRQFADIAVAARGTAFQQRVWRAIAAIPFGETRSYADVARAIGQPKAMRAVGLANGRNPVPIIVPCHRVIGADGSLTGFGGGLAIKRWLLEFEGVEPSASRRQQPLRL